MRHAACGKAVFALQSVCQSDSLDVHHSKCGCTVQINNYMPQNAAAAAGAATGRAAASCSWGQGGGRAGLIKITIVQGITAETEVRINCARLLVSQGVCACVCACVGECGRN